MDRRQRRAGANYVAMQGKRFVPFGLFLMWLANSHGEWLPPLGAERVWVRLAAFGLAFALYWIVGWFCYIQKYGGSRGSVPRSVGEVAPWVAVVTMMSMALLGEDIGLAGSLVSLAATMAGAVVMVWIAFGEFFGSPRTHGVGLLIMLLVAAMLESYPQSAEAQSSLALSLTIMGVGLVIGGPLDSSRLTRDLNLLSGRAR